MTGEATNAELEALPLQLDQAAPGSRITDLIYYSDEELTPEEEELTPEEIVDTALARVGTWDDD